ncbi:hypothetical protein HOY80DRAFT_1115145 [Tuber brumale]|nr:hypothetical protein HOY80DRAFT_1115145 [Tuber brumale]
MTDYLAAPKPLAVHCHEHNGAQDSPPTDDCPSTTPHSIPESLPPSPTAVSVPVSLPPISFCLMTLSPSASSQITGSVAPSPATLIAGSITPSPMTPIFGSVTPSPAPPIEEFVGLSPTSPVAGSGLPSPTIQIVGSVAPSPVTLITESVVPAPTISIAVSDPPGTTTFAVTLCATTSFQVATSVSPFPLVANAATVPIAQTASPPHPPTLELSTLTTPVSLPAVSEETPVHPGLHCSNRRWYFKRYF